MFFFAVNDEVCLVFDASNAFFVRSIVCVFVVVLKCVFWLAVQWEPILENKFIKVFCPGKLFRYLSFVHHFCFNLRSSTFRPAVISSPDVW